MKLLRLIRLFFVRIHNFFIKSEVIIRTGAHPARWRAVCDEIDAIHARQIHKDLWEMKKQGLVSEDRDGRLTLTEKGRRRRR